MDRRARRGTAAQPPTPRAAPLLKQSVNLLIYLFLPPRGGRATGCLSPRRPATPLLPPLRLLQLQLPLKALQARKGRDEALADGLVTLRLKHPAASQWW
jgi:hypothetical protein